MAAVWGTGGTVIVEAGDMEFCASGGYEGDSTKGQEGCEEAGLVRQQSPLVC